NNLRYSYPTTTQTSSVSAEASPEAALSTPEALATAPVISTHAARLNYSGNGIAPRPALDVTYSVKASVLQSVKEQSSAMIVLRGVTVPEDATGAFDIMSIRC